MRSVPISDVCTVSLLELQALDSTTILKNISQRLMPKGVENLFKRLDHMATYAPVFCDITWGAGGSTADVTLAIAIRMQNVVGRRG